MRWMNESSDLAWRGRFGRLALWGVPVVVSAAAVLVYGCGDRAGAAGREEATGGVAVTAFQPAAAPSTNKLQPRGEWVEARPETLREYTTAVGTFRARQTTRIGAQVAGRVQDVLVDVGSAVEAGQVLVRLDPTFFELELQQQRAGVEAARSGLAKAEAILAQVDREMRRYTDLYERGAAAPDERENAVTAHQRALAERDEVRGRLTEAEVRLQYLAERLAETEVRAPYAGVVTQRMVDPGQTVASGPMTDLLEVQDLGALYLEFSLPQALLGSVSVGSAVEFEIEGVPGPPRAGAVETIYPAVDEATRSFRLRVVVQNADGGIQPGLLARVRVQTSAIEDALVVPRNALRQTANGWKVFTEEDGRPAARVVELGTVTGDLAQITSGLRSGERVLAQ